MTGVRRFFWHELLRLLRGRTALIGTLGLLVAGAAAVESGRVVVARQEAVLAERHQLQDEQHRAILGPLPDTANAGDQLYYLFFHTAHHPDPWASLSLGTRESHAFNLRVRLLALEGQLYDAELANPSLLALGTLDLALVLVFLAPLLTIALTFNALSEEVEGGTWALVRAQPVSAAWVAAGKFAVRGLVASLPVLLLWGLALVRLDLAWDVRALLGVVLALAYVWIWVALAVVVSALGGSSELNAMALIAVWVLWAQLGPAGLNAAASLRHPVPEALELTVQQRQGYHAAWDRPVDETMALFYRRYPEWRTHEVPRDTYSNAWYYAMQQRGDDEAADSARRYRETVEARADFVRRWSVLFPPALLQQAFDTLAATELRSHLRYLDSVRAHHDALKRYFFPAIFTNARLSEVSWEGAPDHSHRSQGVAREAWWHVVVLATELLALLGLAAVGLRHRCRIR